MKQALIELVDVILKKIQDEPDAPLSETGLRKWLMGEGYQKPDIEAAMQLVRPRFDAWQEGDAQPSSAPLPVRALSTFEQFKLTAEARNALYRLERHGLMDAYEREMILDRLNHFEGEVGLSELDYLVSWVVCGSRDVESQQTIYGVMDGGRDTLN